MFYNSVGLLLKKGIFNAKYMVKRIFPVWLAKSTRTLSSRLVQVSRTDIMPNGNISRITNPFLFGP